MAGHGRLRRSCVLVLALALAARPARCDCRLGVLRAAGKWAVTETWQVTSIVPDIIKPESLSSSRDVAPRPSEAAVFIETRPPLAPRARTQLCIRSLAPYARACGGGAGSTAAAGGAAAAGPAAAPDASASLFNASEGAPLGPCLELTDGDTAASFTRDRPHADDCWPGAGYCTDVSTAWSLTRLPKSASGGTQQLYELRIVRKHATYQDTDSATGTSTWVLRYALEQGCGLKAHAPGSSPAEGASLCIACSASKGGVALADAGSSRCLRCPSRSGRPAAATPWVCGVPGLPKAFESVAVRLGPGGQPECASSNGKTCLRSLPGAATCAAMLPLLNKASSSGGGGGASQAAQRQPLALAPPSLQPLACGAAHRARWGISGYETPGHWCGLAREHLQDRQPASPGVCMSRA